jgi:hypothetical protein
MTKQTLAQRRLTVLVNENCKLAKQWGTGLWGPLALRRLRELTIEFGFSLALGDIQHLDAGWYVTHAGLLRLARRSQCKGIRVQQVAQFCDPVLSRWVFRAIVFNNSASRGFVGYGDADPSNVSSLVQGAEMRVAETRAANRALRKAYGIGLCSVEELGTPRSAGPATSNRPGSSSNGTNGHHNGQPRLRDRLCLLIRQHQLDATLVKAFAADYCGARVLHDASRESVEAFINDLAERATKDRDGLLSHLNTYAKPTEVSQ